MKKGDYVLMGADYGRIVRVLSNVYDDPASDVPRDRLYSRHQVEFPFRKSVNGENVKIWCARADLKIVSSEEYNTALVLES